MPDYIQITTEQWLRENHITNATTTYMVDNAWYPIELSTILAKFAKVVIEQAIDNCAAHSDSEIDKEGALVNTYRQFSFIL